VIAFWLQYSFFLENVMEFLPTALRFPHVFACSFIQPLLQNVMVLITDGGKNVYFE
jgi:hypothetical protein